MKLIENPYYSLDSVSNSKLTLINPEQGGSPALYQAVNAGELEKKEHLSLERGKLVHLFALEPDSFKVADVDKPSDSIRKVIDDLYWNGDSKLGFSTKEILLAAERTGYQNRWGDEAKLKQLDTEANKKYYEFLCEQEEYVFLSSTDKHIIDESIQSIKAHPYAKTLIFSDEWDGYESYNELMIESVCPETGIKLKGLLDRLMIDHRNKTIIIPDLKTTSRAVDTFNGSYEMFRYYRQHAFYGYLVKLKHEELFDKGYHIEYKSVVVNVNPGTLFETRVFNIHPDYIERGRLEYIDLLSRIQFANQFGWEYPREHWLEHSNTGKLEYTIKPL